MRRFQIGEVVDVTIPNARIAEIRTGDGMTTLEVEVDDDAHKGRYQLVLGSSVGFTPKVPADGVPAPGEVWADQSGQTYFVVCDGSPERGTVRLAPRVNTSHRLYFNWPEVHAGPSGPIYRLWRPAPDDLLVAPVSADRLTELLEHLNIMAKQPDAFGPEDMHRWISAQPEYETTWPTQNTVELRDGTKLRYATEVTPQAWYLCSRPAGDT